MRSKRRVRAFTIMEMMIVVIIIGIVSGFSIPNYQRAVEQAHERDAIDNIKILMDAVKLYRAKHDGQLPPNLADINAINTTLKTSIIANQMSYACGFLGLTYWECRATSPQGWWLHAEPDFAPCPSVVHCIVASPIPCPTIPTWYTCVPE